MALLPPYHIHRVSLPQFLRLHLQWSIYLTFRRTHPRRLPCAHDSATGRARYCPPALFLAHNALGVIALEAIPPDADAALQAANLSHAKSLRYGQYLPHTRVSANVHAESPLAAHPLSSLLHPALQHRGAES